MKKIIILTASILIAGFISKAQTNILDNDTTKIVIKGKKITIITEDDSTKIEVDEDGKSKKGKSRSGEVTHFKGLYIGVAGLRSAQNYLNLSPSQMELNYARSFNWQINMFEKSVPIVGEYVKISTGLGINLNSYQIENNLDLTKGPTGVIETVNLVNNYDKNKLRTGYLTVPLLLGFSTTRDQEKGLKIAAGIVGGYRIQGNIKKKFTQGGETFKPKYRSDLHLNDFTYSALAKVSLDKIQVYAEYSLQPLFAKNRATEMYPFSIGVRLIDWN